MAAGETAREESIMTQYQLNMYQPDGGVPSPEFLK